MASTVGDWVNANSYEELKENNKQSSSGEKEAQTGGGGGSLSLQINVDLNDNDMNQRDSIDSNSPKSPKTPVRHSAGKKSQEQVAFAYKHASGEQDYFYIAAHWMDLFNDALQDPDEATWISNYTILHYAVTKSNEKLLHYILEAPQCPKAFFNYLHLIDDFGKKPIDHLANAKGVISKAKKPMADYIQKFMDCITVVENDKEKEYQDIKVNGPLHKRKSTANLSDSDSGVIIDSSGKVLQVATGEEEVDLTNIMTAYEVETLIPTEYKKPFKVVNGSAWKNYTGKWPKDESLLHWAAKMGHTDICRYLVMVLHADAEEEDGKGRTAIQLAKSKKHRELARSLHTKQFPTERDQPKQRRSGGSNRSSVRSSVSTNADSEVSPTSSVANSPTNSAANSPTAGKKSPKSSRPGTATGSRPTSPNK